MSNTEELDYEEEMAASKDFDAEPTSAISSGSPKRKVSAPIIRRSREINKREPGKLPDDDDYDDKDEIIYDPMVNGEGIYGKPHRMDEEEEAKKKKRLYAAVGTLVLIALFAMFLILGLVFKQEDTQPRGIVGDTNAPTTLDVITPSPTVLGSNPEYEPVTPFPTNLPTTREPTRFPTSEPTPLPTPAPVTGIPTPNPTPIPNGFNSPTASPIVPTFTNGPNPISKLPCSEITVHENVTAGNLGNNNFAIFTLNRGRQVCSDTFAGFDPSRPNRNYWTPYIGRRDCVVSPFVVGTKVCEDVGARRCTADELAQGAGQGTGCGGDNTLLWSSTSCSTGGREGYLKVNYALKTNGTFFECEPDLLNKTITRCCGDLLLLENDA